MLLARLLRQFTRLRIQPHIGRVHAWLLRRSGGRIRRSFLLAGGQPVLALTTTGRRSGRPRMTTVAYVRYRDGYAIGALNLGSDKHPAWCLNLRANGHAWVEVDGHRRAMRAREASGEEAEGLWARFVEQLPQIQNTRDVARRQVPIIVLEPVGAETPGLEEPREALEREG